MEHDPVLARACLKILDDIVKGAQPAVEPLLGAEEAAYWLQQMGVTLDSENASEGLISLARRSSPSLPWNSFRSNFDFHLAAGCISSFIELARWCEIIRIFPLSPRQAHELYLDSPEAYNLIQVRIAACEDLFNCSLKRMGFDSRQFFRMHFLPLERFDFIGPVFRFARQNQFEPPPRKAERWYFCSSIMEKFREDLKKLSVDFIQAAIKNKEIPPGWERRQISPSSPVNSLSLLRVWLENALSLIQVAISLNREDEVEQAKTDSELMLRNAQRVCRWLDEYETADSINTNPLTLLDAEKQIHGLIRLLPEPLIRMRLTATQQTSGESKPVAAIELRGREMPPLVYGQETSKRLSENQFTVVATLLSAFPGSLLMPELIKLSSCENAVKTIAQLRTRHPWTTAIVAPGRENHGAGYRIAESQSLLDEI